MGGWLRRVLFPDHRPHGPDVPRVLVITTSAADQKFYRAIGDQGEWNILITQTVSEALDWLASQQLPIVLCDREIPGWDWREVLARVVGSSPQSCFLLTSRVSDEFLWREVVMHGGYDVVSKPLVEGVVRQALKRAWYYWKADRFPQQPTA